MKKLLFIVGILFLTSCEEATMENSVKNPKSFTTLEMQNLEKDTVVMAKDKDFEYVCKIKRNDNHLRYHYDKI